MSDDRYLKIESRLAWCGWDMPVPAAWEPLKIEGTWQKGSMMVGPEGTPVVLVKWWRPGQKNFDAAAWLQSRFKALGVLADETPPTPVGFETTGWVRNLENQKGQARSVWYGYSSAADVMVECISTSLVAPALHDLVFESVIPALKISGQEEAVSWSVFHTCFETPPGCRLTQSRLALGDIGLNLKGTSGCTLLVRQVYPAGLALARRSMQDWVDSPPFLDRRRINASADTQPYGPDGLRQRAWKRLPAPMGWLRPRYCDRAAVVDHTRDRLCIAELQDRAEFGPERIDTAMKAMQS